MLIELLFLLLVIIIVIDIIESYTVNKIINRHEELLYILRDDLNNLRDDGK